MVRKNEQVSNTVMWLGAALAVIRYNAGYSGIRELFHILEILVNNDLSQLFTNFDQRRESTHINAGSAIKKRSVKRKKRGQTRRLQTRRDGVVYCSRKHSGAQKATTDESLSEEDNANHPVSCQLDETPCVVCCAKELQA